MKESKILDPKNLVKNREILYRLIISQLFYDGHHNIAEELASIVGADPPCPPSDRLLHVMIAGMHNEPQKEQKEL